MFSKHSESANLHEDKTAEVEVLFLSYILYMQHGVISVLLSKYLHIWKLILTREIANCIEFEMVFQILYRKKTLLTFKTLH